MQPRSLRLLEGFAPRLAPFDVDELDALAATVCGVSADLTIGYVNPARDAFALANGADTTRPSLALGASVRLAIPPSLRGFHEGLFIAALTKGSPVGHDYDCSSPTMHRVYRMAIHPCPSGAYVVVHSLSHEEPHAAPPSEALEPTYRDANGMIVQCANCRRVRRAAVTGAEATEWDWVPDFAARVPARTSHGLCEICSAYYYP